MNAISKVDTTQSTQQGARAKFLLVPEVEAQQILNEIAERLLSVRLRSGLSQRAFAKSINSSASGLIDWEKGRCMIASHAVFNLHNLYGIDPTWLLTGE